MRKLTIVFTKSKKKFAIGSWLIMLWTWKSYSHVAIKFESAIFKSPTYYQASDGLVNYMSENQFLKKHEIVKSKEIQIPEELYSKIRESCHEEAGAPYGFLQNLGIVYCDILSIFGVKVTNPFKDGRNCSELLYGMVLEKLGVSGYDPNLIKPHHIEEILTELNLS